MSIHDRDWYWEARETAERAERSRGSPRSLGYKPVLVVLAVIGGITVAWLIGSNLDRWREERAAEEALRTVQRAVQRSQIEFQDALERNVQPNLAREREGQAKKELIAEQRKREADASRAKVSAAERKARAWQEYFQPSEFCTLNATVECANKHIRAKRSFEEKYSRGEL